MTVYVLEELVDEAEGGCRDFSQPSPNLFESEHGPVMGNDGDDNPEYARPKPPAFSTSGKSVMVKLKDGKTSTVEVIESGQIHEAMAIRPKDNPAGEIVDGGHGFIVTDPGSRPWKLSALEARYCWTCGEPTPQRCHFKCEFNQQPMPDCACSGCQRERGAAKHTERGRGNPSLTCSEECNRERKRLMSQHRRAVERAGRLDVPPPPEPARHSPNWTKDDQNRLAEMQFAYEQRQVAVARYRANPPAPRRFPYGRSLLERLPPERYPLV